MTDRRQQIFEVNERRQVYNRINELKSNCEQLKHLRDNLRDRLRDMNDAVDKLVDEKNQDDRYDSCLKTDLFGAKADQQQTSRHRNRGQTFTSTLTSNDLNDIHQFSSHRNELEPPVGSAQRIVPPSDAFKMKLSHCLHEVVDKAEEIANLSEFLANKGYNVYEQIRE